MCLNFYRKKLYEPCREFPQGTLVIQNLSSVLYEEGQWKFPHEFNPENFLNDRGELQKPEAFIPFSVGKNPHSFPMANTHFASGLSYNVRFQSNLVRTEQSEAANWL